MKCAWDAFLTLVPHRMRQEVNNHGKDKLLELRLRIGLPPELVFSSNSLWLEGDVTQDELSWCINVASKYSPWSTSTISSGYITGQGGHRLGICGNYIDIKNGVGIHNPGMINIRVARDIFGVSKHLYHETNSILILGKPGSGKTTLLRDLIRQRSENINEAISVVDEREELFPRWNSRYCFFPGRRTDILSGCKKSVGLLMLLKNMTPNVIAVDEITEEEDCEVMMKAGWCGVSIYATAHATSLEDLYSRVIYRPIVQSGLFSSVVIMHRDKSWHLERISK